jgi:ABC-type microcin C transport system duplicated ATPase subunit YejF
LASWSVQGDKTNKPGCLKQHLEELFDLFPCLKLLTGDAIYAQRSLLQAIQKHHRNYTGNGLTMCFANFAPSLRPLR